MSARRVIAGVALLATLSPLLIAGCNRAGAAAAPSAPPKVTVRFPESRTIEDEAEYGGWLQAAKTVEVRARVRGHIEKVHFKDGDLVQKDQLLFELDQRPFQAEIDATLANANALDAQRIAAQKDFERNLELNRRGAVTKADLEKSEADYKAFEARVVAVKQQAERSKLDLEYSRITAPIAGRISRAMLTEGNLVNAGGSDPLLTTIVSVDPIFAYFQIDERMLQRYRAARRQANGDAPEGPLRDRHIPFRFALDSDEGFPHKGELDFSDNQVDTTTGTIEVRGVAENADGRLVAGSRIRVRVPVSEPYEALLISDEAILADQEKRYVLIVGQEDVVLRRDVKPGRLLDDGMRIVLAPESGEPLTKADRVITIGTQRARVNYPVQPVDENGQPVPAGAAPSAKPAAPVAPAADS
ncbi:MAG: efflux RND transporter periplasmic adaptor subunit [Pirellulales bacterium]